jgi:hypothetical protein
LRLHVSRTEGRTVVRILKRRGGGLPAPVVLDLYSTYRRRRGGATPLRETREPLLALP